ncbi:MAG TPA: bifunctional riboflavin kinase/FAD synthetase [Stellaceae bacterium]|nr:bifunctional riboflavin kinase/FAD synthetase [Stellaceae bacterium]
MRILRHPAALEAADRGAVVAIGNFDGVHLGHQLVIRRAGDIARAAGAPLAVLTFEPHPYHVFNPAAPPFRLTPLRAKSHLIEALGVDLLFVLHFDLALAQVSAEDFVRDVIAGRTAASHVLVGYDFHFGHKRRGTPALLEAEGRKHGFAVTVMAPIEAAKGVVYSSTRIRRYLTEGRPREAAVLLGRPFEIEGRVETGDKRGRTIGFPTANIALADYLRPAGGVYVVRIAIEGEGTLAWRPGVANLGTRPTVGGTDLRLEAHLFDFDGELYGKHLRVALIEHLRPERKFAGLDDLKAQIAADAGQARAILAAEPGPLG